MSKEIISLWVYSGLLTLIIVFYYIYTQNQINALISEFMDKIEDLAERYIINLKEIDKYEQQLKELEYLSFYKWLIEKGVGSRSAKQYVACIKRINEGDIRNTPMEKTAQKNWGEFKERKEK